MNEVFSCAQDNGHELRGHHGKRAAQRRQQREEERKQREEEEKRKTDDINDVLTKLEDTAVSGEQNTTGKNNGEILETRKEDTAQSDSSKKGISESSENPNDRKDKEVLPTPPTKDGSSECVPQRIREQWKKSGRDSSVLVEMSNGHYNTLLVVDNQGKAMSTFSKKHSDEDKWILFYENAALLDEIRKDVIRTHPDLYFFLEPEDNLGQRRYAAMERILFVWAKRNIGVSIHMCVCVLLLLSIKFSRESHIPHL
jgi:hypothetical protein